MMAIARTRDQGRTAILEKDAYPAVWNDAAGSLSTKSGSLWDRAGGKSKRIVRWDARRRPSTKHLLNLVPESEAYQRRLSILIVFFFFFFSPQLLVSRAKLFAPCLEKRASYEVICRSR